MSGKSFDTEHKILTAAKKIFIHKGMDGARMQEIADEAEINKALLHYYFRSKDKLFDAVIQDILKNVIPDITSILRQELPFEQKIAAFIPFYHKVMSENPFLPPFIILELNKNPKRIFKFLDIPQIQQISRQMQSEISKHIPPHIKPEQIIVSVIGATLFPFLARPVIEKVLLEPSETKWDNFITQRPDFLTNTLKLLIPNTKNN